VKIQRGPATVYGLAL